ncbi:ribosome maturation factor RimP [Schaalia suimastitidis]|uniref:ribosome maturation factor RimP n=1 Tax=Schaalia suimastitidis TaxID=121163 RepID=UPI00040FF7A2|nr:ribosome assembly cofactor RimP [Schaalia suimastitidis]
MPKPQPDEHLHAVLTPVAAQHGVEVDTVVLASQYGATVVRVVVEEPEGQPPLDSETLADVSRAISRAMDDLDPVEGEYLLEVTTPGIERPLLKPAHWRRVQGRLIRGKLKDGRSLQGHVLSVDDSAVTLDIDGEATTIDYNAIKKARACVEFAHDFDTEE